MLLYLKIHLKYTALKPFEACTTHASPPSLKFIDTRINGTAHTGWLAQGSAYFEFSGSIFVRHKYAGEPVLD